MTPPTTGPRIVAIGDSVTLGVGDGVQAAKGDVGWAAHVGYALGASPITNIAENGTRARDLVGAHVPQALALSPDLVLMTIGGNDVLRGDFDPEEIRKCVRRAAHLLRAAGAQVILVTLTPIPLFDLFPTSVTRVMARRVHRANASLLAAVEDTGVKVLDGASVMRLAGASAWNVDRIHPSAVGHRALAARAVGLLDAYRPQRDIPPPAARPALAATVWWIVRNGLPWIAKRSRDLIPQIALVVLDELHEERATRARAIHALRDERGSVRAVQASSREAWRSSEPALG